MERTIDWGGSGSPYETHVDRDDNGRVVLAEDTNGNTVLLEYDESSGEWVYGGPVNMGGSDISNVGAVDAAAVSTGDVSIGDGAEDSADLVFYDDDGAEFRFQPDGALRPTDGIRGTPTGVYATISAEQDIEYDDVAEIEFDSTVWDSGDFLDPNANEVVVPEGVNYAKATLHIRFTSGEAPVDVLRIIQNTQNDVIGRAQRLTDDDPQRFTSMMVGPTAWFPVAEGDSIHGDLRHLDESGDDGEGTKTLRDESDAVWLEVLFR